MNSVNIKQGQLLKAEAKPLRLRTKFWLLGQPRPKFWPRDLAKQSAYIALYYRDTSRCYIQYTDFAKAFDTVPHHRLILKLKAYNIDTDVVLWITDFLCTGNRKQCVVLNGEQWSWFKVISGIRQGSILGPCYS